MHISFNPIAPWFLIVLASAAVLGLSVWAYRLRLRGTAGRWRWVALGLRIAAVLLCLLAALRPSVVLQEKKKQSATILVLDDRSLSMRIHDEVGGKSRWEVARDTIDQIRPVVKSLGPNLETRFYDFDSTLRERPPEPPGEPAGRGTALGDALLEAAKRAEGKRIAALVVVGDGNNNEGIAPLVAAQQLKSQSVPIVTVPLGSDAAGEGSKDIAVRDLVAGPTVFVKNQLQVKGTLVARGFAEKPIVVELFVEDQKEPVAQTEIKVPEGKEVVPITGLKYIPQTSGEKKVTLWARPREGELMVSNNSISTFITVLRGGLSVLYLQGPNFTWEYKFLMRSIAASPDIQVDLEVVRAAAGGCRGEIKDEEFTPGRYDAYILGDLPADHLTANQQRLLTAAVEKGAGLIMLGGRSSFGPGGWASTPLARVLPVTLHPGDGQLEPEGGVKFVPNPTALDNYILQIGGNRAESARVWGVLPPLSGTNRFGSPKPGAVILGQTGDASREPVMLAMDTGKARVLAFGGETWPWARASEEGRNAHRKFWRQIIFWLAHKEDKGENEIKLKLDGRRIAVGQKVELTVTARDPKGEPIPGLQYETKVTRDDPDAKAEPVDLYAQGDEAKGAYYALGQPGDYKVTVTASRQGHVIGTDSARFLVYQDDRELENPAADRALLRQLAELTGGVSLPPEELAQHLKSLNGKMFTVYISQTEHRVWDNWPFLLIFTTLLTLEWWLRKRHGWV